MTQILIIEDEDRISSFIAKGLKAAGMGSTICPTASQGFDLAATGDFDLIVLDIGLPDRDGLSLLDEMRGSGINLPVIILTARSSVSDTVAGLESGADDYMAKPFRFEELLARIRLRLRERPGGTGGAVGQKNGDGTVLEAGGISLNLRTREVRADGKRVELSAREFALLEVFVSNSEQVLTREQFLSRVWGYDFDPGSNVVDVYVRYLREKLGASHIVTVRGTGYRLG